MHIAVKPGSGIPTRGFREVFQAHGNRILLALFQIGRDIKPKRVVAIRPIPHFFPINIDLCVAHGSIEQDKSLFAGLVLGNVQCIPIPTYSHKRKSYEAWIDCGLSSRVNFHPFSNSNSVRTCADNAVHKQAAPIHVKICFLIFFMGFVCNR